MADGVQLENGYVRIANRLVEALLEAEFTGAQVRIILALARLTYGWRRRTVSDPAVQLAKYAGLAGSGGYRRALRELVQSGVVIELRDGRDTTFALQKDFTNWGKFSVNERKLAAIWDRRPKSDDTLLKHMETTGQLTLQGHVADAGDDDETESGDPTGSGRVTLQGHTDLPQGVTSTGAKSLFDAAVESGKDIERQERQTTTATAAREADDFRLSRHAPPAPVVVSTRVAERMTLQDVDDGALTREYAIDLAVATNRGVAQRWGEQIDTITYATGLGLAEELRKANVPLEVAREAIIATCVASKKLRPMSTVSYFREPILEAFRAVEQRAYNAADPGLKRGGAAQAVAAVIDPLKGTRNRLQREDNELAHGKAQTEAAIAWGKDPRNAAALEEIKQRVHGTYAGFPEASWVETARTKEILSECAKACAFPDFATWMAHRDANPEQSRVAG